MYQEWSPGRRRAVDREWEEAEGGDGEVGREQIFCTNFKNRRKFNSGYEAMFCCCQKNVLLSKRHVRMFIVLIHCRTAPKFP